MGEKWLDRKSDQGKIRIGFGMQKVLLLLLTGLTLGLSASPRAPFKILDGCAKDWKKINQRSLRQSIRRLYQSRLIGVEENEDGTITLILTESGKRRALRFDLEKMRIVRQPKWDGWWRVVIFDVPETNRQGRNALSIKLRQIGFYPLQRSVLICPWECKKELDFVVEIFKLRKYVRYMLVKETDIDLDLKHHFNLA